MASTHERREGAMPRMTATSLPRTFLYFGKPVGRRVRSGQAPGEGRSPEIVPAPGQRHGGSFPLPTLFLSEHGLDPPLHRQVSGSILALNQLAAAKETSRLGQGHDASPFTARRPPRVQDLIIRSVSRRIRSNGVRPLTRRRKTSFRSSARVETSTAFFSSM